jgi:type II secretory pathway component GspD/PulD (secretin)
MKRSNQVLTKAMVGWLAFVLIGTTSAQNLAESPFSEVAAPASVDPTKPVSVVENSLLAEGSKPATKLDDAPYEFCECVGESESGAVKRIERALRGPLHSQGLDFRQIPLNDVVTALQDEYGIPIQLDAPAMDEIGMNTDEPVTVQLNNISLRSALRLILKTIGLTYHIQDEVLIITTPQQAEECVKVCVYDVRDLAAESATPVTQGTSAHADYNPLVGAITDCIHRDTWRENGGNAEIRPLKSGLLVISQTAAVHEEIRSLLATIREMRQRPTPDHPVREPEPAKSE